MGECAVQGDVAVTDDVPTVVLPVHPVDTPLFPLALLGVLFHLPERWPCHVVTPDPNAMESTVSDVAAGRPVVVSTDNELLTIEELALPARYRQQLVKLRAWRLVDSRTVVFGSADLMILAPVAPESLVPDGSPLLRYNCCHRDAFHIAYERERVQQAAALLGVRPTRSLPYADFVFDLFPASVDVLKRTEIRLIRQLAPTSVATYLDRVAPGDRRRLAFSEWALYAVSWLDVLGYPSPTGCAPGDYRQAQTMADVPAALREARVVHVVPKGAEAIIGSVLRQTQPPLWTLAVERRVVANG